MHFFSYYELNAPHYPQLKSILKYQTNTSQAHQSIENRCHSPQIHTEQKILNLILSTNVLITN